MVRFRFDFDGRKLSKNVGALPPKIERAVAQVVDYHAAKGEAYLKTDAPWTDRTSAARNGLHTVSTGGSGDYEILFSHAVHYGIWLEVKFNNRDEVIMPTVRKTGTQLMDNLQGLMRKL